MKFAENRPVKIVMLGAGAPAGISRRICTGFCTRWNGLSALSSVTEISWKKRTLYGRISHRRI